MSDQPGDAADRLSHAIKGTNARARDLLGGSNALIFDEARREIERLRKQNDQLRVIFRVNMIRAAGASHAEIDKALADALGETTQ